MGDSMADISPGIALVGIGGKRLTYWIPPAAYPVSKPRESYEWVMDTLREIDFNWYMDDD